MDENEVSVLKVKLDEALAMNFNLHQSIDYWRTRCEEEREAKEKLLCRVNPSHQPIGTTPPTAGSADTSHGIETMAPESAAVSPPAMPSKSEPQPVRVDAGNESSQPIPDTAGPTPTKPVAWVGNQCPKCGSPVERHGYQNCAAVCTSEWCLWSSFGAWMKDHQRKYVVIAHRGGDHENHSYPVGVASSVYDARKIAEAAEQYRGGKYACSIWRFRENESDMERADAEEPKIFQDCKPIPGWKTHAEKMIDEHRLVALCKEIVAKW